MTIYATLPREEVVRYVVFILGQNHIYWGNILISTRMKNDKVGKGWGTTTYTNYTTQDCLDLF